jgi:hypothetical protein
MPSPFGARVELSGVQSFLPWVDLMKHINSLQLKAVELGYRLKQHGYQIRLCKTLQVKHWKRWDVLSVLKTDIFRRAVPCRAVPCRAVDYAASPGTTAAQ